jgi:hypothetical protein
MDKYLYRELTGCHFENLGEQPKSATYDYFRE